MKKIILLTSLFSLCTCTTLHGQLKVIKVGMKGYGGANFKNELNALAVSWIENTAEASNIELTSTVTSLPFNREYGYQPFFIIHPIRLLQIGVKLDRSFSNIESKFENTIIKETYELKMQMKSYMPGAFVYLTRNSFEIGGGILYSHTSIKVNDNFFGYYDTWSGNSIGYEASMGFSSSQDKLVGFTMSMRYRYLQIKELTDSYNRKITYSDSHENMQLNLSGFFIDAGLYFQFVNLKRKSK